MMNPKGSWNLTVNAFKKSGFADVESWMPPEPKAQFGEGKNVKDKWTQIKQGEMPTIDEGDDVLELYMGFNELAATKRDELDKEYQPNLDVFLFRLNVTMFKEMQRMAQEQQANRMAMGMVRDVEEGRLKKKDVINA
jgi:hypothetical protein